MTTNNQGKKIAGLILAIVAIVPAIRGFLLGGPFGILWATLAMICGAIAVRLGSKWGFLTILLGFGTCIIIGLPYLTR